MEIIVGLASDVVRFDDWDSGKLGLESLDPAQLLRDVAFEESNIERVGEAREDVRSSGWDWSATRELLFGGGAVGLMGLGYVPSAFLKAGRGAAGAYGMLSSYDVASRLARVDDPAVLARAARRQRLKVEDGTLVGGANEALRRFGFWQEPGRIPGGGIGADDVWEAANSVKAGMRGRRWLEPAKGAWSSNPTAELLPTEYVSRFAEFDRATAPLGTDIDDLARSLRVDGFNDPLILEVDSAGRAALIEGNHRVAAAARAGISAVPVRVVTSTPGALAGRGAEIGVLDDFGSGKMLKPSEAISFDAASAEDAALGRIRMFHGVSPRSGGTVDEILQLILKDGLMPDPGRKVSGNRVWGSASPRVATSFGWGDRDQEKLRAVVEFVTEPSAVKEVNGFPSVSRVPKDDVAAIHLMNGSGDVIATKQVNGKLGSVLDEIDASRRADGGFTWNPRTGGFDFSEGYISGVSPLHTRAIPVEEFTAQDVIDYLDFRGYDNKTVGQLLAQDPSKMVGGWAHEGRIYLDVSKVFDSEAEALKVATRLGEDAIWDAKNAKSVFTSKDRSTIWGRAMAAKGGGASEELLAEMRASGLEKFFTGPVGGAELRPELSALLFGNMNTGQKAFLADELKKADRIRRFTPADFDNDIVREWMKRERTYLRSLDEKARKNLLGSSVGAPAKLVDFAKDFDLERVPRSLGVKGAMHRKIIKAILNNDTTAMSKILSAQSNNIARFLTPDYLTPNFYPYMAYMTVTGARNIKPTALAPVLAVASARAGPGREAGVTLEAATKMLKASKRGKNKYYDIVDGQAVWKGGSGLSINPARAMVELANNPDWIMNPISGLSVKTYVYGLLKLNPKLPRGLVIDTVDTQLRFATDMGIVRDTTVAAEVTEVSLNQFANRMISSALDVPAFSVQENSWGVFRSIRDMKKGTPKSLMYKGVPLRDIYRQVDMPDDLTALYQKNYAKLLQDVRAGRAPHWQEIEKGVLVPADDLPLEMLLPPTARANPQFVERFRDMVNSAEELGRKMRIRNDS